MKRFFLVAVALALLSAGALAYWAGGLSGETPAPAPGAAESSGLAPTPAAKGPASASGGEATARHIAAAVAEAAGRLSAGEAQNPAAAQPADAREAPPDQTGAVQPAADQAAPMQAPAEPASADQAATDERGHAVTHGVVEKGDTIAKVLGSAADDGIQQYVSAARRVFSLRSFREGQPYVVVTDPETGRVKRFEYEIDGRRRLVVEGDDAPQARVEPIEYVTLLSTAEGVINDNLFQAVADIGESPQLALSLAELFGSEVNFIRDLQEGDSFRVLIEKRYREGEYKGYGRVLAASFTNKGKTYEAFLFRDGSGRARHYNSKGENLHKTLLQAPLAFTRLTSRFTHSRRHPILGGRRPHLGVDYAAPTGTPVKAVGEGVVVKRGWAGGYGNQIILRHNAGLESMYAHLSGYARGLKQGQRVRQGQVIGFVGSTGLSTGPHLDFRLRQNGTFVNPAKAINPRGAPVSRANMAAFHKTVAACRDYLEGRRPLGDYTAESLVPEAPVLETPAQVEKPAKKQATRQRRGGRQRRHGSAHRP